VLLCALAVHAVVWPSVTPHEGETAYAHAYQPLIGLAGVAAVAVVAVLAAIALTRGRARNGLAARAAGLAGAAVLWVVAQESVEQSLSTGRPALFSPSATTWALLVLAALAAAVAVTAARHAGAAIVRRLARRTLSHGRRARLVWLRPAAVALPRLGVLALGCGMRAPPVEA
jgi:hypothetical protein